MRAALLLCFFTLALSDDETEVQCADAAELVCMKRCSENEQKTAERDDTLIDDDCCSPLKYASCGEGYRMVKTDEECSEGRKWTPSTAYKTCCVLCDEADDDCDNGPGDDSDKCVEDGFYEFLRVLGAVRIALLACGSALFVVACMIVPRMGLPSDNLQHTPARVMNANKALAIINGLLCLVFLMLLALGYGLSVGSLIWYACMCVVAAAAATHVQRKKEAIEERIPVRTIVLPPGPLCCVLTDWEDTVAILEIQPKSRLLGKAKVGDIVTAIDGKSFGIAADVIEYLSKTAQESRVLSIKNHTHSIPLPNTTAAPSKLASQKFLATSSPSADFGAALDAKAALEIERRA